MTADCRALGWSAEDGEIYKCAPALSPGGPACRCAGEAVPLGARAANRRCQRSSAGTSRSSAPRNGAQTKKSRRSGKEGTPSLCFFDPWINALNIRTEVDADRSMMNEWFNQSPFACPSFSRQGPWLRAGSWDSGLCASTGAGGASGSAQGERCAGADQQHPQPAAGARSNPHLTPL